MAGQNVTNEPGRIEVTADKYLALPQAQISSVNYILLKATNQFGGSSGAQIAAPYADLYLRSTNGLLNLTNVLVPYLPRPIGVCDLFSARWTNVVAGVTNRFHVLFVGYPVRAHLPADGPNPQPQRHQCRSRTMTASSSAMSSTSHPTS